MMVFKRGLAVVAALLLAACEQAQIHGPIAGGSVTVTQFNSGELVHQGTATPTEAETIPLYGQEAWDGFSDYVKLLVLGIHQFGDPAFTADTWYVMSVDGGFELDHEEPLTLDANPFQVQGSVHALVKGERLNEGNFTLSPVTEAAYQYVRDYADSLSGEQLQTALDAAAQELVGDVDGSGAIDYDDLLEWNYLLSGPLLLADTAALALAMEQGQSQDNVQNSALALFASSAPAGVAEAVYASSISDIVESACGAGCHYLGGIGANQTAHDLTPVSSAADITTNVEMYRALVASKGVAFIVNKATRNGVSHVGGAALRNNADITAFENFLLLL